nr:sulfatase-like hydrolase/transferase [Hankyongella ginsenosidimutans]
MLAACGEEATGPGSSENNPDNVVLIVVSNLSPADIDTPSTDEAPTPNIDVLAAQGVRFLNAYTSASVSVPARMSLYTGRTPAQLGFEYDMPTTDTIGVDLTRGQTLLPGMLKQSGYVTGFVGAWGLGGVGGQGGDYPGRQGFDEVYAVIPRWHPTATTRRPSGSSSRPRTSSSRRCERKKAGS